jgi:hypothetical protein
MARAHKTLDAMRANPRDWRIESLEAVAAAHGVNIRKPGGSHVVFEHPGIAEALSVPTRRPITARLCPALCRIYRRSASEQ